MQRIGSIAGIGVLLVGDERFEGVEYVIHVFRDESGATSAHGRLAGEEKTLVLAFVRDNARLELETSGVVNVVITEHDFSGFAEILVIGPVPGF